MFGAVIILSCLIGKVIPCLFASQKLVIATIKVFCIGGLKIKIKFFSKDKIYSFFYKVI